MRTLVSLAILTPLALSAPALKGKPTLYYATEVGTILEYEIRSGDKVESVITDTIAEVENADRALTVTIKRVINKDTNATMKLLVTEEGLSRVTAQKLTGGPQWLLKLPAKPQEKWTSPPGGVVTKVKYTTIGEDEIEVPAGKFKAVRVDSVTKFGGANGAVGTSNKQSYWYAADVGIVQMTSQTNNNPVRTQLLKKLTAPKK